MINQGCPMLEFQKKKQNSSETPNQIIHSRVEYLIPCSDTKNTCPRSQKKTVFCGIFFQVPLRFWFLSGFAFCLVDVHSLSGFQEPWLLDGTSLALRICPEIQSGMHGMDLIQFRYMSIVYTCYIMLYMYDVDWCRLSVGKHSNCWIL